jgi:hypothetical protein
VLVSVAELPVVVRDKKFFIPIAVLVMPIDALGETSTPASGRYKNSTFPSASDSFTWKEILGLGAADGHLTFNH